MSIPTRKDIGAFIKAQAGINPQDSAAATINGGAIDRQDFDSCVLHAAAGAATGAPTAQTVDAKLQDSPDGTSGWADIAGAAITQITADNAQAEVDIDLSGAKRYIRAIVAVGFTGGTTPTIPVAATVVLGGGRELPA